MISYTRNRKPVSYILVPPPHHPTTTPGLEGGALGFPTPSMSPPPPPTPPRNLQTGTGICYSTIITGCIQHSYTTVLCELCIWIVHIPPFRKKKSGMHPCTPPTQYNPKAPIVNGHTKLFHRKDETFMLLMW